MAPVFADIASVSFRWTDLGDIALRLSLAALLGGLIGLEREIRGRSAGLRTQMLVAVGAALAMVVSLHFETVFASAAGKIQIDPARVAYGVMTGVGFLGAGAILRFDRGVRGLTTAASLWCTAAVGLAAGFAMYATAVFGAALVVAILWMLRLVDHALPHRQARELTVCVDGAAAGACERLSALLEMPGVAYEPRGVARDIERNTTRLTFRLLMGKRDALDEILRRVEGAEGVRTVRVEVAS